VSRGFALRVAPTAVFLTLFFAIPVGVLFAYSFGSSSLLGLEFGTSLDNYDEVVSEYLFGSVYVRTLLVAAITGALVVALALPFAYAISLGPLRRHGDLLVFLVLASLFCAYIVRVYAWRTLLGRDGVINSALEGIGLIDQPLEFLLYSRFALVIALVNVLLPFAVLPLYAALRGIDPQVIEAARSLGASSPAAFLKVTLPLASRGVIAAFVLCFVMAAGDYVTPQLVGGTRGQLVGNLIVSRFGLSFDWPMGSALAFVLVAATVVVAAVLIVVLRRAGIKDRP
jgi:spermidine/putrescine transport system permease protein